MRCVIIYVINIKDMSVAMKKVLVGLSGGVDSAAAAMLLIRAGYEVHGVTLNLCGSGDVADAAAAADFLGIPHTVLDGRKRFSGTVIKDFITQYQRGRTPNPCVVCNEKIKFGLMLDYALQNGFDYIATGHYARVSSEGGRYFLQKGKSSRKDQSYFLYRLTEEKLKHILFPLGEYEKEEVRAAARDAGIPAAHLADSQDICFISSNHAAYLKNAGVASDAGDFIDKSGAVLGRHNGIINYTVGQRKGLGTAFGKRLFVLGIDPAGNTVTLGEEDELYQSSCTAGDLNFINTMEENPISAEVKIRYNGAAAKAKITLLENEKALVEFERPQRAVTPGQSAVFYSGGRVLGGGIIK